MKNLHRKHRQGGITLIEVLIALFVLSVGLLGHSKIQALGVRAGTDANLRTQASYLLNEMIERMRANRPAADTAYYASIDYSSIDCSQTPDRICTEGSAGAAEECTSDQVADDDALYWFCEAQNTLPNGDVSMSVTDSVYSIQVLWNGSDEEGETQARNVSASFIP